MSPLRARRWLPVAGIAIAILLTACGSDPPISVSLATTTTSSKTPRVTTSAGTATTAATGASGSATTAVPTTLGAAAKWVPAAGSLVGLPSECGNLALVAARPDRDEIIVSVAKQGLWSAKNGSTTFERLGQGSGSATVDNRGTQILFDPKNADTFWESGMYGSGVFRTTDGGKTFQRLGAIETSDPMSIDFTDPTRATMLSGKHEDPTLRRSTNGGASWTEVAGLPAGIGFVTYPLVLDTKTYLVGTQSGTQSGIYRSTDAGVSWTQVFAGAMNSPALVTTDGIFWLLDNGALVRSTDQGLTWTPLRPAGFATPVSENMIRQMPDGRLYTIGRTVLVSADKGVNWTAVGPEFPYLPNGVVFNSFRNEFLIWHFDCDFTTANLIKPESIMKLSLQPTG